MSNCLCPITLTPVLRECPTLGGVSEIYIAQRCDITSTAETQETGVITGVTMATGGTVFNTFQLRKGVANMTTTVAKDATSGVVTYTTDVNLKFSKLTAASRLNFLNLANGETIAIVKHNDGTYWMVGDSSYWCEVSAGTINTGVALTDPSQYDVTLQCVSQYPPKKVELTDISTILDTYAV